MPLLVGSVHAGVNCLVLRGLSLTGRDGPLAPSFGCGSGEALGVMVAEVVVAAARSNLLQAGAQSVAVGQASHGQVRIGRRIGSEKEQPKVWRCSNGI